MKNTYAIGDVISNYDGEATSRIAGLLGGHYFETVENSYATGEVNGRTTGENVVGGLIADGDGTVYNSFWDMQTTNQDDSAGGTGKTTVEMKEKDTFTDAGWDFEYVWDIDKDGVTNHGYPFLRWTDILELTMNIEGEGSIEIDGKIIEENWSGSFLPGREITLVAISDDGWLFRNWTGDHTGEKREVIFNIHRDKEITAHFKDIELDYEISNWKELYYIRDDLQGNYTLDSDLDETSEGYQKYIDTEKGWKPIGDSSDPFKGELDANGYEIRDFYINREEDSIGLFDYIGEEGSVGNVSFKNTTVNGEGSNIGTLAGYNYGMVEYSSVTGEVSGEDYTGGLLGRNYGILTNSYFNGTITGLGDYCPYIGGLVGTNHGTIEDSYVKGDVSGSSRVGGLVGHHREGILNRSYSTVEVVGLSSVGGLVGFNQAIVTNSYATGNASGDSGIGGLVGLNWETVSNSYAIGEVSGQDDVGGLVGDSSTASVENSFWDIETSGIGESEGGTGKTTEEMKDNATYTDTSTEGLEEPWDFVGNPFDDQGDEDIWDMDEGEEINEGYPFLSCEISIDSTEGGEVVEPGEGNFNYHHAEFIDLEAVADKNYTFDEWSGDTNTLENTTNNKTTIKVLDDHTITAEFVKLRGLEVNSSEGGEVIKPGEETFTYANGTEVNLKASPEEGWKFTEWTGENETIENTTSAETTIEMLDNHNITAEFEKEGYTLTIDMEGKGEELNYGEGEHEIEFEEHVELEANSAEGWQFDEWTGYLPSDDKVVSFDMSAEDIIMTAHFEKEEYTLTIDIDGEGEEMNYDKGTHEIEFDEHVELEASSAEGWQFVEWTGYEPSNDKIVSFDMPSEDVVMTAHFEIKTYELTVNTVGEGSVDIEPEKEEYMHDEMVDLTAIPDDGWYFVEWMGDVSEDEEEDTINLTMDADKEITAHFNELHEFEITVRESDLLVIPDALVELRCNETEEIKYENTTDEDGVAHFSEVSEGEYEYIITHDEYEEKTGTIHIDEDKEIDVELEPLDEYRLELRLEGEGAIYIETEDEYWELDHDSIKIDFTVGTEVQITAEADEGWSFSEWTGEVPENKSEEKSFNITMEEDREMTVHFESVVEAYNLTFIVEDEGDEAIEGATVTVDGETVDTDEDGEAVFEDLEPGTYDYEVDHEHFETVEDEVDIVDEDVVEEVTLVEKVPKDYDLTFVVEDDEGEPIEGATVEVDDMEETTDTEGEAVFEDLEPDIYDWEVTHDDYEAEDGDVEIVDQDETVTVAMEEEVMTYDLFFEVEDEDGDPIEGATVEVDDMEESTDTEGEAVFEDLQPGSYSYEVSKSDHEMKEGEVTIEDEDVPVEVTLENLEEGQLEIEIIEMDTEVEEGEEIVIEYRVENTGDTTIKEEIEIVIYRNENDGDGEEGYIVLVTDNDDVVFEHSETYELDGGDYEVNEITAEIEEEGDYQVSVSGFEHEEALDLPDPDELEITVVKEDEIGTGIILGIVAVIVIILAVIGFLMMRGKGGSSAPQREKEKMFEESKKSEGEEEIFEEEPEKDLDEELEEVDKEIEEIDKEIEEESLEEEQ